MKWDEIPPPGRFSANDFVYANTATRGRSCPFKGIYKVAERLGLEGEQGGTRPVILHNAPKSYAPVGLEGRPYTLLTARLHFFRIFSTVCDCMDVFSGRWPRLIPL